MTHPLDRLSANPPPACDEPNQPGTEPGDECGRWQEPDEDCPVSWQCGGKSGFSGNLGRMEGVHQHMKTVHGVKQKWKRTGLLERMKEKE